MSSGLKFNMWGQSMRVSAYSKKADGFSLVEVNLAVLLVSVGLLSLFMLFPLGLRESHYLLEALESVLRLSKLPVAQLLTDAGRTVDEGAADLSC